MADTAPTPGNPASIPAEIARTLTPAMREAMADVELGVIVGPRTTLVALARRGLCGHPRYESATLTVLGRAVRAVVTQNGEGDV